MSGLNSAINGALTQDTKIEGAPFEIVNPMPSEEMLAALLEVSEMINNPQKYPRYNNLEDLKKALLADE